VTNNFHPSPTERFMRFIDLLGYDALVPGSLLPQLPFCLLLSGQNRLKNNNHLASLV